MANFREELQSLPNDYKKKIEELKRLLDEQEYEQAALTADEIPVKKLKSAYELNLVGKAYKCNGDFLSAKDAFGYKDDIKDPVRAA